jgi:hypothetical protein
MPLLDHFHPPVSERRAWEGVYILWSAALVEKLNSDTLADDYYAHMQVDNGLIEVDITTADVIGVAGSNPDSANRGTPAWTPPTTALVMPTLFPDEIAVQVFTTTGATLVGAIELVSPRNKDRSEARRAFAAKCVSYLTRGIGLIVVDIVTNRLANLHNEVIELMGQGAPFLLTPADTIYTAAYRPSRQPTGDQIEMWPMALALGQPLPVLPLRLRNAATIPVDLDTTYNTACQRSRLA